MTEFAPRPVRDAGGRFVRGNPGRPFGTRNRMSKRVARAILADFEKNQRELLPRMRRWFLPQYLGLVGRLMPRVAEDGGGVEIDQLSEADMAATIAGLKQAMARLESGEGSLADVEAALLGEGVAGQGVGGESGTRAVRHNSAPADIGD